MTDEERQDFRVLTEKKVAERIILISWCPTMDLLLAVSARGEIFLYRLSWQKVWSISLADATVQAVAWRPDGKVIAIGYSDGKIKLHDVSTAKVIYTIPLIQTPSSSTQKSVPITCLHWAEEKKDDQQHVVKPPQQDDILQYLPQLSAMPDTSVSVGAFAARPKEMPATPVVNHHQPSDRLNLLVAGDANGNFHLSIFGIFNLGVVSLSTHPKIRLKNPKIIQASVTPDLSILSLLVHANDADSTENSEPLTPSLENLPPMPGKCFLLTFDTVLLHFRKSEIRNLPFMSTSINFLVNYLTDGIKSLVSTHRQLIRTTERHLEIFEDVIRDHTEIESKPIAEFMCMLATGIPSSSLNHFLQRELTERGLKRWEKSIELYYSDMIKMVQEHLIPACERLLIRLGDVGGYSRWHGRFGVIGLEESSVFNCISLTGKLVGRLEELFKVLDVERRNFKEFMQWLHSVLNLLQPDDASVNPEKSVAFNIVRVVDYLKNSLTVDALESFFVNQEGEMEYNDEIVLPTANGEMTSELSKSMPHRTDRQSVPFTFSLPVQKLTLNTLASAVTKLCNKLFEIPAQIIGQSLILLNCVKLSSPAEIYAGGQGRLPLNSSLMTGKKKWKWNAAEKALENVLLTGMRTCTTRKHGIMQYLALIPPESSVLWVVRIPLSPACPPDKQSGYWSPTKITWRSEIARVDMNKLGKRTCVIDLEFYDDESLAIIAADKSENGTPQYQLIMTPYPDLEYLPIVQPPLTQGADQPTNIIETANRIMPSGASLYSLGNKYRCMEANFVPIRLATNGRTGRRIACLLAADLRKFLVFDTDNCEDEEDEEMEEKSQDIDEVTMLDT
ncbi:uncharacterized protein VTP21DRAFT_11673 [Calcarisporiella thermophila]|uniref:uncharacterized protein n=1 Tax=Calcarisporiella thermophila TaxID=911321 RepID=UPI0037428F10